jgi:peroxiredoxin
MTLTASTMLPLNTVAPHFELLDIVTQQHRTLQELQGNQGTMIMFICNHCPYVKHVQLELVRLATDYQKKGITFIAISSNDIEQYPEDAPPKMRDTAKALGYPFPYLFDETQSVAKAYQAACTPDFFLFNEHLECVYRGQLDDSRPGNNIPVTGSDLRAALNNLLAHKPIDKNQKPSVGCNIKWKEE